MDTNARFLTPEESWELFEKEYAQLRDTLISRPLTIAELHRVGRIGHHLLVHSGEPYDPAQVRAEFAALLAIQNAIQTSALRALLSNGEGDAR